MNNTLINKSSLLNVLLTLLGVGALLFIGLYRQPYYPTSWFDEGLALQGAINLVRHGEYAMRSVEGFRVLDQPLIANGPGIVLPISLVFSIFGIGLFQARVLMALYFAVGSILFFLFTQRLYGKLPAFISLVVLFSIPLEGFIIYGRQALGNVPGFVYFLIGCLFFIKLVDGKALRHAILTGLFFGLALITKGQYILLFPTIGLLLVVDWWYYKHLGLKNTITLLGVVIACFAAWQVVQFFIVGAENYAQHLAAVSSSSKISVFAFELVRLPGSVWYLVRSGFLLFIAPALLFVAWNSRRRDGRSVLHFFLVSLVVVWVTWYTVASVGWNRYAFEAYAIGSVFVGYAVMEAVYFIRSSHPTLGVQKKLLINGALILFLVVLAWFGGKTLNRQVDLMLHHDDPSPQILANYLEEHVPQSAVIESWEWEIDALANMHTFHHPTNDWVDRKTGETHFGDVITQTYDPFAYNPAYILTGPFSEFTKMYISTIESGCCVEVFTSGGYTLYEVKRP